MSFDEIARTEDFKNNLKIIRDMVRKGTRIALVSNDTDLMKTHRTLLVGRALQSPETYGSQAKPVDVMHIQPGGRCVSQKEVEDDLVKRYALDQRPVEGRSVNVFFSANQHPELSNFSPRVFTAVVPRDDVRKEICRGGLLPMDKVGALLSGGYSKVADAEVATQIPASMLREVKFSCVEQYYQYSKGFFCPVSRGMKDGSLTAADKTLLYSVQEKGREIMSAKDPAVMQRAGGETPGVDLAAWREARSGVMYSGMKSSFNPEVNKASWSALDRTGELTLTHLQADPESAQLFSETLMRVRSEYRDAGYGKTYKKEEMVVADPPLIRRKAVLVAAYSSGERDMRRLRTESGRGVSLGRNMYRREYERSAASSRRYGRRK